MGNFEASNIRVQDLDHSGIIAGICAAIPKSEFGIADDKPEVNEGIE